MYRGGKLVDLAYKDHPFMALVKKEQNLKGRNTPLVPWFATTAGRSATFASAQANVTPDQTRAFLLTPKRHFGIQTFDMLAIAAASSDDASFLKQTTDSVDGVARAVGRDVARKIWRNFGGSIGRIAAGGVAGNVVTLANPGDIVNIEHGMRLRQSTTDGTSGALGAGNSTVVGINRRAGTFELAAATNFVANDYLFLDGDFGLSANGVAGWIPAVAPTVGGGDSFLGVDRSVDSRLYGQYLDAATLNLSTEEAIGQMDVQISREGGKATHVFINPIDFGDFRNQLSSQAIYDKSSSPDRASISFSTLQYQGVKGNIQIVPDADCPQRELLVTQLDSWVLKSVLDIPHISNANGDSWVQMASEDSAELRQAAYFELGCYAPAFNGRVQLA
jgi:hypothetical protein